MSCLQQLAAQLRPGPQPEFAIRRRYPARPDPQAGSGSWAQPGPAAPGLTYARPPGPSASDYMAAAAAAQQFTATQQFLAMAASGGPFGAAAMAQAATGHLPGSMGGAFPFAGMAASGGPFGAAAMAQAATGHLPGSMGGGRLPVCGHGCQWGPL